MSSSKAAPPIESQDLVDAAITSRRSVRAFLPTTVPNEVVQKILSTAARAPSGTNIQPWRVYVLTGSRLKQLSDAILSAYNDPEIAKTHVEEYPYYPKEWVSPYLERRRKIGWDLYGLLGITREDKDKMHHQHGRNYAFFDAPVGLIFSIDRVLEQGSWLDYGMFLQNIMVAARGRGLDTCPQAAFNPFQRVIREQLQMPENETLVCGMALGYADPDAVENRLTTERESIDVWATFLN
jgi:nitroreductase